VVPKSRKIIYNNIEDRVLKNYIKIFVTILFVILFSSSKIYSNNFIYKPGDCDSLEVLKLYSLFSEYHKNKDFASALPYGWQVLECDADKFRKWIYYKMEDGLWYLHDSTDVSPELKESIEDTIIYLYDLAIEHFPEQKAYFESHKAFILEGWLEAPYEEIIAEYEKAIKDDKDMSSYYYNRLGLLYIVNASDENDYETKAINLYMYLSEREPDNPQWPQELEGLVKDLKKLVELTKKNWYNDKENLGKAWKFVQMAQRAENYPEAIEGLEFLVEKSPETVNYWNRLATAYQKTDQLKNAESALLKLIEIDPAAKEHYLNLGINYGKMGKLSKARKYYIKASEVGGGWALSIYYEGLLYEKSARACNFDFETKMVYQLAVDTFWKAVRMDPALTQAKDRIGALSTSVPTQEDYFFRGYKSGQVLPIEGDCFTWIGKSVTVP
jgi:tetratricopeptide (TPR) repeat protein